MSDAGERRAPGGAPKRRGGRQKKITVAEKVERDRKVISIDEKLRKGGGGWPGMGVEVRAQRVRGGPRRNRPSFSCHCLLRAMQLMTRAS